MHTLLVCFVASVLSRLCVAIPNITLLGAFDYQMDESSPLVWSGRLVIMESIPNYNPQHQSFCATDYFIVRDLLSWDIISTIESSCNHAFGNALVTTDEKGIQTMWVFGTLWARDTKSIGDVRWGGPCSMGKCASGVFWSTDLKTWHTATAVTYPPGMTVYNTDTAFVAASPPSLPRHNWVMIIEEANPQAGSRNLFYVKNSTSLDVGQWILLDPSIYFIPNFNTGANGIGAGPSIRFIPQTGYYYVTSGGNNIFIIRSQDLSNWELGHYNGGAVIMPSLFDCTFMAHSYTAWNPSEETVKLMDVCLDWDLVVSDSDMTEIKAADGSVRTMFLYQPNNLAGIKFSNLFIYYGNFQKFFESYFVGEIN